MALSSDPRSANSSSIHVSVASCSHMMFLDNEYQQTVIHAVMSLGVMRAKVAVVKSRSISN